MANQKVLVKINRWGSPMFVQAGQNLAVGDVVIIETDDGFASAIVQVLSQDLHDGAEILEEHVSPGKVIRKANLSDIKTIKEQREKSQEALNVCREEVKKMDLPMKVIDADYSFDGGSITFAFIADGRIDFRELVKNLSKNFQRSIRLHQMGARDESRQSGGYGICGRELCCVKFKGNLPSISSEMAKVQQISHRGSERISGICGRLMCCLAYEAEQYRQMIEKLPKIGDRIKHKDSTAVVKDINILTQEVKAELEDKSIVFINLKNIE